MRSVAFFGEGEERWSFLVDGDWVFQFPKHRAAARALQREVCLLPVIRATVPVLVPNPELYQGPSSDHLFSRYRKIPGALLTRRRYLASSNESRARLARLLGTFLARLHGTTLNAAHQCDIPVFDYRGHYSAVLRRAETQLFDRMQAVDRAFIVGAVQDYCDRRDWQEYKPTLLHADLGPEHILHDPHTKVLTGVIDFGDLMIGDPAWELTYLYEDYGTDLLDRLLDVYQPEPRSTLLPRVHRFLELDAMEYAVTSCGSGDTKRLRNALRQITRLRRLASHPPWEATSRT